MIHPIRYYGDPILRRRASEVKRFDADLARLAGEMIETMYLADGVGLAAPQIGLGIRLFVALETVEDDDWREEDWGEDDDWQGEDEEEARLKQVSEAEEEWDSEGGAAAQPEAKGSGGDGGGLSVADKRSTWGARREHVVVNPSIIWREGVQYGRDGCLSIPGMAAEQVPRSLKVRLRYQDLAGQWQELSAEGYFAHVLQHEFDHLEGVLYFDRLPEAERRRFLEEHRTALAELQRDAKERAKSSKPSRVG